MATALGMSYKGRGADASAAAPAAREKQHTRADASLETAMECVVGALDGVRLEVVRHAGLIRRRSTRPHRLARRSHTSHPTAAALMGRGCPYGPRLLAVTNAPGGYCAQGGDREAEDAGSYARKVEAEMEAVGAPAVPTMHAREHARMHVPPCAMWRVSADPAASVGQVLATALGMSYKGRGADASAAAPAAREKQHTRADASHETHWAHY